MALPAFMTGWSKAEVISSLSLLVSVCSFGVAYVALRRTIASSRPTASVRIERQRKTSDWWLAIIQVHNPTRHRLTTVSCAVSRWRPCRLSSYIGPFGDITDEIKAKPRVRSVALPSSHFGEVHPDMVGQITLIFQAPKGATFSGKMKLIEHGPIERPVTIALKARIVDSFQE